MIADGFPRCSTSVVSRAAQGFLSGKKQRETARWWRKLQSPLPPLPNLSMRPPIHYQPTPAACTTYIVLLCCALFAIPRMIVRSRSPSSLCVCNHCHLITHLLLAARNTNLNTVMLDSQQDTTSPGAWQRHHDEETVCHASLITRKTKAVPSSNLQESLTRRMAWRDSQPNARWLAQRKCES